MTDEGYIKFICEWEKSGLPFDFDPAALLKTRDKVFEMGLIGYDAKEKVGYGNISCRFKDDQFIISGTQTGHIKNLLPGQLSHILNFDITQNYVKCGGPAKASSESLTHASIYLHFKNVNAVIHVHSEKMWERYLNTLPTTDPQISYGTPEMAFSVKDLFPAGTANGSFVMGGHKDGLICFGNSLEAAMKELGRLLE